MPPTHPSPPKPLITIRPRRQPEDLLPLTHLLQTVYERDAYPVLGTADAAGFLMQTSTVRAWVAESFSSPDKEEGCQEGKAAEDVESGKENGEKGREEGGRGRGGGQIVGHVAVSRPREGDVAVRLWRALHPRSGAIPAGQEEKEGKGEEEEIAVLERLFVDPAARGHGLASSLLETAEKWARTRTTTTALPEEEDSRAQDSPKQQQQQNPEKQAKGAKKATRLLLFALAKDENAMRLYRRRGWEEFGRTSFTPLHASPPA
ncbi:hypothetical protein NU195Hw_Modified_275t1 [Hortaea werneckii]